MVRKLCITGLELKISILRVASRNESARRPYIKTSREDVQIKRFLFFLITARFYQTLITRVIVRQIQYGFCVFHHDVLEPMTCIPILQYARV